MTDTVPSEHLEQREFVRWFRQTYKGVRIFAIPNGGQLGSRPRALALACLTCSSLRGVCGSR